MENQEIIVVYAKRREEFAHLLSQLINSTTEYGVAEWEEKHWDSSKPTILASQKIIYLGSAGDSHHLAVEWHFNNFSMKYGWLGDRCVLDVGRIDLGKVSAFKKHYKERAEHFKYIADKAKGGGLAWFALLGGWVAPILLAGGLLLDRKKLKKYQYQLLVCEFIFEGGFKKFMEG